MTDTAQLEAAREFRMELIRRALALRTERFFEAQEAERERREKLRQEWRQSFDEALAFVI